MSKTVDVAEIIADQPFGPFHVRIIVLCLLIQFLDGFDTQALAFAGPALRDAWGLGPQGLGTVVSLGAIGTGIGSICGRGRAHSRCDGANLEILSTFSSRADAVVVLNRR